MSNNNEYINNQRKQKREFKKFRKAMWRVLFGFIFALASAFILPEYGFPQLFGLLQKAFSTDLSALITVLTQIGCVVGGAFTGLYNGIKAIKSRNKLEELQDKEEDYVNGILDERDEYKKKYEEEKSKNKKLENQDTNEKVNERIRRNVDDYTEEEVKTFNK